VTSTRTTAQSEYTFSLRVWLNNFATASPSRFALISFTLIILLFTGLLSLPFATRSGVVTPFVDAFFTAVSSVCVTGLSTVNMATHWSFFGDVIILLGLEVGGIGVLTFASMLGLIVSRRLGLRQRLLAASDTNPLRTHKGASESQAVGLGDMGGLLASVAISVLVIELILTLLITPKLLAAGYAFWDALWNGFYFAVSAFTNTGFVPLPDGMAQFGLDPYMLTVLAVGVFLGSIGFPVIFALYRYAVGKGWRAHSRLPIHTKVTLSTTAILVVFGALVIAVLEWNNALTLGDQLGWQRVMTATYTSVMTRSGGLATIDVGEMHGSSLLFMDMLMFVGGGSASTAGGIKVTTLAVLFFAAFAEARGYRDMQAFDRRIPTEVLRVAVSVVLWGATIVATASILILQITGAPLDKVLFDVISAFGTCGLSTGLTEQLPDSGKYILAATMWAGRVGTVTLAAALAASSRTRLFRYPEERPIVG
jgi:Trk-type K+ transport system membrane component